MTRSACEFFHSVLRPPKLPRLIGLKTGSNNFSVANDKGNFLRYASEITLNLFQL